MVRIISTDSLLGSFDLGDNVADGWVFDDVPIPRKKRRRKDTVSGSISSQPIVFNAPPAERVEIGESITEDEDFQW